MSVNHVLKEGKAMRTKVLAYLVVMMFCVSGVTAWAGTEGPPNVFYGSGAGASVTTGIGETFLGINAGNKNTTGNENTFLGDGSGWSNTTGSANTFVGASSGLNNTTGGSNTFLGLGSGSYNTTGGSNTFLGTSSGLYNTTGGSNTFVGDGSGRFNTEGYFNTFLGYDSGSSNTTGTSNTSLGYRSGFNNATGNYNVFLGFHAGYSETGSNRLYIDNCYTGGTCTSPLIYGEFDNRRLSLDGKLGINTKTPTSQIETAMDGGANSDIRMKVASSGGGVPVYYGMRSGGSLASPTATPTGKGLFWLGAMGHDGTAWTSLLTGLIGFYSTENWTSSAMGTDMRFFTTANLTNTRVERLRVTHDGRVGIGTTAPVQMLDVNGNVNTSGDLTVTGSISGNSASVSGNVSVGSSTVTGNVSAGSFSGNGSGITNVNAATLNGQSSSDIINAAADEVRTPISSLPFTISSPGSYYLTGDLTSTGDGIIVNADNVTIDFSGFTITGPGKMSYTGFGVYMNVRRNVEIKNGTVRGFGLAAIRENSSGSGHRVLYMRIQDNGSDPNSYGAISFNGNAHYILNCTLTGNACAGINAGYGATVIGNAAYNNGQIGIYAERGSFVSGNASSYNTVDGISANAGSVLIGNTASFNGRSGIAAYDGSTVKNNSAFQNAQYGISLGSYDLVDGNTAYNNNTGGGYGNMNSCGTCAMGLNVAP